jgi:hypothetical protein
VIPPGVTRPQRGAADGQSAHPAGRGTDGLGLKRTAASMYPYGNVVDKPERIGHLSHGSRAVLGDLEVQRDGSVKRPRLS